MGKGPKSIVILNEERTKVIEIFASKREASVKSFIRGYFGSEGTSRNAFTYSSNQGHVIDCDGTLYYAAEILLMDDGQDDIIIQLPLVCTLNGAVLASYDNAVCGSKTKDLLGQVYGDDLLETPKEICMIQSVAEGSEAEEAGFRKGDIILGDKDSHPQSLTEVETWETDPDDVIFVARVLSLKAPADESTTTGSSTDSSYCSIL